MAARSLFRVRALLFAGVILAMAFGQRAKPPPRTRRTSSYTAYPKLFRRRLAECTDSSSYTDAESYGCADWAGYACEGKADSAETTKQCPKTCDACPAASSCQSGKFADGEACTPCLADCLSCTNAASCTTCGSNFRFVADKTACVCEDHPTWTDAGGSDCAAWGGYDCATSSSQAALEANCPKTCGKCLTKRCVCKSEYDPGNGKKITDGTCTRDEFPGGQLWCILAPSTLAQPLCRLFDGTIKAQQTGDWDFCERLAVPFIVGVVPRFSSTAGGEKLLISGGNFPDVKSYTMIKTPEDKRLVVTVGGEVCSLPTVLNPSTISCITPPAVLGNLVNLPIQVIFDDNNAIYGLTRGLAMFSYKLPRITYISRDWLWHKGSVVSVHGEDFVDGQTYCRLGELGSQVYATVLGRQHLQCTLNKDVVGIGARPDLVLYVSNDGGQRWVSGLVGMLGAVRWFNNSATTPVTVNSVYKTVHVAAIVPDKGDKSFATALTIDGLEKGAALAKDDGVFGPETDVLVHLVVSHGDGATAVAAMEVLLLEHPDVVGIVGDALSVTTIPLAFNVSLPRRLPMISYGAQASILGNKKALPYFLRTAMSSVDEATELSHLFNAFR